MVIEIPVKQALLRSVLPDGTVVMLVVLHDDRCAILRNGEVVHQAGGDAEGIDDAVQRFMAMTQVSDVLGTDADSDAKVQADAKARADDGGSTQSEMTPAEMTRALDAAGSSPPPSPKATDPPAAAPRRSA